MLEIIKGQTLENGPRANSEFGTSSNSKMNFDPLFVKGFDV